MPNGLICFHQLITKAQNNHNDAEITVSCDKVGIRSVQSDYRLLCKNYEVSRVRSVVIPVIVGAYHTQ